MPKTFVLVKNAVATNMFILGFFHAILFFGIVPAVFFLVFGLVLFGLGLAASCIIVCPYVGAVVGLLLSAITARWYYPLKDADKYRRMVSIVSAGVYMVGGLISTAIIIRTASGTQYDKYVGSPSGNNIWALSNFWSLVRLGYAGLANGDFYNVPGGLFFGLGGFYVGQRTSKWYIAASAKEKNYISESNE